MTITDDPRVDDATGAPDDDAPAVPITSGALAADDAARLASSGGGDAPTDPDGTGDGGDDEPVDSPASMVRAALAAGLATSAAGLVIGGIFASWLARGLGVFAAALGAGWALYAARSPRTEAAQALFPFVLLVVSALSLVTAPGGPGELPTLVGDAIDAGRSIRPPVPFDPGWRVLIIVVIGTLGFAAASVGINYGRPRLAVVVPLPLIGLASITQPESEQFIAGISAFLPVLAAIGVLFGGDQADTGELDRSFEAKRLVRGLIAGVPLVAVLVALNSASFLFPEPVFDPDDKPQKPRAAPLAAAEDRVLFEVSTGGPFTGPWRIGALDVYEDDNWLIPGFNQDRLVDIGADGVITERRAGETQIPVTITVRDLGDSAVLPLLGGATAVETSADVIFDPRMTTLRVPSGRAAAGLTYTLQVPDYPTADQLEAVDREPGSELDDQLLAPEAPDEVLDLLARAPTNPWLRLDFLRNELLGVVTASGAGAPVAVPPSKVVELLSGETGTPFEIVAAEALLARWAGVPSRIGFGFDGLNVEDDLSTVRPRNAAQWLEVWFEGYGWAPLIGAPAKAESSLDSDPNARFNPTIEPSSDVAVEVYLPFELEDLTQLYQRIRDVILQFLPLVFLIAVVWAGWPVAAKAHRRSQRRRWAAGHGPRTQIAVEYAEFRDAAIDLGVGDIYDTPLEYLTKVRADREHTELAWLAARALYGDMVAESTDDDVLAAETLSTSLRRRLGAAQPLQVRILAAISRASLSQPYTDEIPNGVHRDLPVVSHLSRAVRRLGRLVPARLVPGRRRRRRVAAGGVRPRLIGDPR